MSRPPPPEAFLYADYGCPHSLIAFGRLGRLAAEGALRLCWRGLPSQRGSLAAGLSGEYRDLTRDAADLGYALALPESRPDTHDAMRAAEFARDCGSRDLTRFNETMFRAVLCEGHDVGSRAILLDVAERAGLDREALVGALEDDRYAAALAEVEEEAERYDITATPTTLIGAGKVVGAAPEGVLREAAARA